MEIQQSNNKTLAAYVHYFKPEAMGCSFNSDSAAIFMFIKGLQNAHSIAAKMYKKDPHTLLEVIKLVKKFNAGQ